MNGKVIYIPPIAKFMFFSCEPNEYLGVIQNGVNSRPSLTKRKVGTVPTPIVSLSVKPMLT